MEPSQTVTLLTPDRPGPSPDQVITIQDSPVQGSPLVISHDLQITHYRDSVLSVNHMPPTLMQCFSTLNYLLQYTMPIVRL